MFKTIGKLLTALFISSAVNISAQTTAPVYQDAELTATILEPGLTVIETADKTTMYLVEGDSTAVLIDTGTECTDLHKTISRLTDKDVKVVLTHGHPDHAGNIRYFDEVYMHPADTVLDVKALKQYKGIIHFINEGDVFDLGGRQLHIIHTPGHTPGSICLIDYEGGIAYTGDAFGSGQLWMQLTPQVPFNELAESCGRMIELMDTKGIERLYVGHYPYLKRPLDMDYMLDVAVNVHRIDHGDTASSTDFYGQWPRMMAHGGSEIVYRPEVAGLNTIKSPTVLLKLDDVRYGDNGDAVPPCWNRAVDFIHSKNIKGNLGIIGYFITDKRPDFLQWLRKTSMDPDIEFWNHGYHNRGGFDDIAEFEQDFNTQYRALHLTDSLATACAGLTLRGWGPHWTDTNQYTDSALATVDNIQLLFGYPKDERKLCKAVFVPENLHIEYPGHNPDYRQFLINYLGKYRNLDSFYLQGHAESWDDKKWHQVEQIIDRLLTDKARFVTISDYITLSTTGVDKPVE